ncbi:MAG: hypothetical protein KGI84_03245 [Elusimicrobia bacterium]|nr:hypothetical protein [Elusimicrobiota bacterium]
MQDKIALLMEETGCDRAEAELALEMCGYDLEAAVKAVPRLFKSVLVVKGRFGVPENGRFGLVLAVLDVTDGTLLRARAVVSFNPAVYAVPLEQNWFAFEKSLYACRLWEGSLQAESLEVEKNLGVHFHQARNLERLVRGEDAMAKAVSQVLQGLWPGKTASLKISQDLLDLGQFKSLQNEAGDWESKPRSSSRSQRSRIREEDILVLNVRLEEDAGGLAAAALRSGDMVLAHITDGRDIAQYLSRLFGGYSEDGPVPILAPVEAVESGPEGVLVRVRFSPGVCGDAVINGGAFVRTTRVFLSDALPWWRRFFAPRS